MDMGQLSKMEELHEKVIRLEATVRDNWSKHLELEARVTELEEWMHAHNLNHSVGK